MLNPGPIPMGKAAPKVAAAPNRLLQLTIAMLVIAAAAILGALGFEHIGGYLPCHLCLMQRTPYYVDVPVAALAIAAIVAKMPRFLIGALLAIFTLFMLYNAGLAAFHAGVEWGWWQGPASCSPSVGTTSATDMLNQLSSTHAPSCTTAALRILGLSLAGWNFLIALFLTALGVYALRLVRKA
jgi:disulfide bond formation protein DsbB